jgi:hypothetical protein
VQAAVIPLLLTMVLFAGPLAMSYYDEWLHHLQRGTMTQYLLEQLKADVASLIFWRNYVVVLIAHARTRTTAHVALASEALRLRTVSARRHLGLTLLLQGPFTEEWVFRSCMCPLLICGGFSWTQTIFLSPFFFGIGTQTPTRAAGQA